MRSRPTPMYFRCFSSVDTSSWYWKVVRSSRGQLLSLFFLCYQIDWKRHYSHYLSKKFTPETAFWRRGQSENSILRTEFWRENSTTESSSPSSAIDFVRVRHSSFFCHSSYVLSLFSVLLTSLVFLCIFTILYFVCAIVFIACQHGEVIRRTAQKPF